MYDIYFQNTVVYILEIYIFEKQMMLSFVRIKQNKLTCSTGLYSNKILLSLIPCCPGSLYERLILMQVFKYSLIQ